jgi:DNA-binding IclR family transcriptional regulator
LPTLVAVAVPVLDTQQRVCAAISVNAPAGRMSLENAARHVEALRRSASSLSYCFVRTSRKQLGGMTKSASKKISVLQ